MKKVFILLSLLLNVMIVHAQEATQGSFWSDPFSHPLFPFYALMVFVFIVVLLVLGVALYLLKVLNIFIERAARERAEKLGIAYVPPQTWWSKFQQKLTDATPIDKEATIMLDHNYDGIKELDNHLPPWWKYLFYFTIVWGILYLFAYHVTDSFPLSTQEYQAEVDHVQKLRASQPAAAIDESTLEYVNDPAIIGKGMKVFETNCKTCHRGDGGGDAGPNLTDNYWLYGGSIKDIFATIKNGKPENGMISWAPILKPEEIRDVAFYVKSIKGTNPANPKPPQGTLYIEQEQSKESQPDSVAVSASL